jgi:hypothetical protein
MNVIHKQYVVNERHQKVAVQLDLATFQKIEEILENYALFHLIRENNGKEALELREAKAYYQQLEKAQ